MCVHSATTHIHMHAHLIHSHLNKFKTMINSFIKNSMSDLSKLVKISNLPNKSILNINSFKAAA